MYVFLRSMCLNFFIERWFWELNMLIESLVELHVGLHSCLCFSPLEKLVLKCCSTSTRYVLDTLLSVELFKPFSYRNLDSSSIPGGSIENAPASSIASRHLVDWSSLISCVWCFCTSVPSRHLYLSTAKSSTLGSTPLDTFICRALLRFYLFFLVQSEPHFTRSLSR